LILKQLDKSPAANSRFANLELCASIQVQCWLTVLCSEIRHCAKHQTVVGHAKKANTHSSTFGFLPTRITQTKKPKELEFCQRSTRMITLQIDKNRNK